MEKTKEPLNKLAIKNMREIARSNPNVKWGQQFKRWAFDRNDDEPYNSLGNGAPMRVSPVGWVAETIEETKKLSKIVTEVTHNHPEGIKGAEAIAVCVFMARKGASKEEIREVASEYYPKLKDSQFTIKWLRKNYGYDFWGDWITCEGSVPQAIEAFLESVDFEDTIRNAIWIGGDSDTIGAMAGAIAEAYYGVPKDMEDKALNFLKDDLKEIYHSFIDIKKERENR